jgi:hypothetical protein
MGIEGVDGCGFSFDLVRTILGLGFLDVIRGWQWVLRVWMGVVSVSISFERSWDSGSSM